MTVEEQSSQNTQTLDLSNPVPFGVNRTLFGADCGVHYDTNRTLESFRTSTEHNYADTFVFALGALDASRASFADLLASTSFMSATLRNAAAAACIQWLAIIGAERTSLPISMSTYRDLAVLRKRITVSPRLRASREGLIASAFLAPSGVSLTWSEVLEDEENDASQ